MLELDQVLPRHAPGARAGEPPLGVPQEPLGMVLVQERAPPRVVDYDVQENPAAADMSRVGQLPELVDSRGPAIEHYQGGINRGEIKRRIRAAQPPEARISSRSRTYRQQVQDPASERVDNVRQKGNQVPQFA